MPDIDDLTANVDVTYADDPGDASAQKHQQDHDILRDLARTAGPVRIVTSTAYTFLLTDAGKVLEADNASPLTWTIPPQASVAFLRNSVIWVCQINTGQLTIAPGAGVTLNSRGNAFKLAGQWAEATIRCRHHTNNLWVVSGDIVV